MTNLSSPFPPNDLTSKLFLQFRFLSRWIVVAVSLKKIKSRLQTPHKSTSAPKHIELDSVSGIIVSGVHSLCHLPKAVESLSDYDLIVCPVDMTRLRYRWRLVVHHIPEENLLNRQSGERTTPTFSSKLQSITTQDRTKSENSTAISKLCSRRI